nr:unnamed protein product [Callosobruchus chinensis]
MVQLFPCCVLLRVTHLHYSEPIGFKAPSFSSASKIFSYETRQRQGFALLCPAQALPIPKFRTYRAESSHILIHLKEFHIRNQRRSRICVTMSGTGPTYPKIQYFLLLPLEPIGYKAPSFSNDATSISYTRSVGQGFGLLCLAQAYPFPSFRASWNQSPKLFVGIQDFYIGKIQRQQFVSFVPSSSISNSYLQILIRCVLLFLSTEPIGSKAPTFSSDSKSSTFVRQEGKGFALLCQAQGLPTPMFSQLQIMQPENTENTYLNYYKDKKQDYLQEFPYSNIVEPTNNVAPKKDGEKYEGWKVVAVPQNGTAWLTCQVTGYPVPRYL